MNPIKAHRDDIKMLFDARPFKLLIINRKTSRTINGNRLFKPSYIYIGLSLSKTNPKQGFQLYDITEKVAFATGIPCRWVGDYKAIATQHYAPIEIVKYLSQLLYGDERIEAVML